MLYSRSSWVQIMRLLFCASEAARAQLTLVNATDIDIDCPQTPPLN